MLNTEPIQVSSFSAPVSGALKSGTWQEVNTSTDAINGTVPLADGVTIPVYQGSIQLKSDETNTVGMRLDDVKLVGTK